MTASENVLGALRAQATVFPRKGRVQAVRLEKDLRWQTERGSILEASPGDWVVSDGESVWTVVDQAFRQSYQLDGHGYERTGFVLAAQVDCALEVPTLEGSATAEAGDWVCWYPDSQDGWPVTAARFDALYRSPPVSLKERTARDKAARQLLSEIPALGLSRPGPSAPAPGLRPGRERQPGSDRFR